MKSTYAVRWGHPRTHKSNGSADKYRRRMEAKVRQNKYNCLSLEQKITQCMKRGGKKELKRLLNLRSER